MLKNIYGLSCVENQVLYHLNKRNYNISLLYYNSCISLEGLIKYFITNNGSPEYFDIIPRVQNTLQNLGIIEYKFLKEKNFDISILDSLKETQFVLLQVNPEFVKASLNARGFRPDHYVSIELNGDKLEITNDIPFKQVIINKKDLSSIYNGSYFLFTIKRDYSIDDSKLFTNIKIPNKFQYTGEDIFTHKSSNLVNRFIDLLRILKLLRHRVCEYYKNYVDDCYIDDLCKSIDKYFSLWQYYTLRNGSIDKYIDLLNKVIETDNKIIERCLLINDKNENK